MSHVSLVSVKMSNLEALKRATKKLGLIFKEGQTSYKWYGQWVNDYHGTDAAYLGGIDPKDYGKCAHAIGLPNDNKSYEIGVVAVEGGYQLIYDFYGSGRGLVQAAGEGLCKLASGYAQEVALETAMDSGFSYEDQIVQADGSIELVFNTY